jgi:hypothetical protein
MRRCRGSGSSRRRMRRRSCFGWRLRSNDTPSRTLRW